MTPARRPYVLTRFGSVDAARDVWRPLADAGGNLFGTWEWATAWWSVYGREGRASIYAAGPAGEAPRAILPLYRQVGGPFPLWRFVGHGPADMLGPVCAPADKVDTARTLRSLIRSKPGVLLAERLYGDDGWATLLGDRTVRREACPVLSIEGAAFDDWLASKSRNFRQQVRRRERALLKDHDLRLRLVDGEEGRAEALDTLVTLHDARWNHRSRVFTGDRRQFIDRFTALAAQRGWLRLWIAELEGRPAAAWLGFRFGGSDWYYAAGRDPRWEPASVGFVLFMHTIRDAFEAGVGEYRMLLGDEGFKQRVASGDPGLETVVVGRRPLPDLATVVAGAARRLPAGGRDRLAERVQGVQGVTA